MVMIMTDERIKYHDNDDGFLLSPSTAGEASTGHLHSAHTCRVGRACFYFENLYLSHSALKQRHLNIRTFFDIDNTTLTTVSSPC